jgi:hypothetical protein
MARNRNDEKSYFEAVGKIGKNLKKCSILIDRINHKVLE